MSSGSLKPHSLSSFVAIVKSVCVTPFRKKKLSKQTAKPTR